MGLHAAIQQHGPEVIISLDGQLNTAGIRQLDAIVDHFRHRGCQRISLKMGDTNLDFSENYLPHTLPGQSRSVLPSLSSVECAVRSQADTTPAARPQSGCGDLSFSTV